MIVRMFQFYECSFVADEVTFSSRSSEMVQPAELKFGVLQWCSFLKENF